MKIKNIALQEVFDSRANTTLEVSIIDHNSLHFSAIIPAGKSTGKNEARVFSFPEAQKALEIVLKGGITLQDFTRIKALDDFLLKLDGRKLKTVLGGNLMLGISIAGARALAFEHRQELWQVLREEFFENLTTNGRTPLIFSNLINGGAHAGNNLDIQEYMVVVKPGNDISASIKKLIGFYKDLGTTLNPKKKVLIGDEGGYAIDFKNNFAPIQILQTLIQKQKLGQEFSIGLDVAGSNFANKSGYTFDKKRISAKKLAEIYLEYFKKCPLLYSIEDPFAEEDVEGFRLLKGQVQNDALIVGDDLTTTDAMMIKKYAGNAINGVIIKPNQIGTVSETCEAMNTARANGVKTIVSHRSGETEDNFLIHIARAGEADGVKIGAPIRERIYKFNELIRIY